MVLVLTAVVLVLPLALTSLQLLVSHYLNGKVYTTVYAHMETRLVGNGQTVRKGQQIGIMGNTGQSTGQHLHFEIHEGPWNASKSNAVDPMRYL